MIDQERLLALIETFIRINNKYNVVDKQPLDYGTGELIYPSEIHLLNAAEKRPDENITEIGNYLGITKSAASQTAGKLVRRGLCRKIKYENRKNIYLELTPRGIEAIQGFRKYKNTIFADLVKAFEDSDDRKVTVVEELFSYLEKHMDLMINK